MSASALQTTTAAIAALVRGELIGPADLPIHGVNSIDEAAAGEITFVDDAAHAGRWPMSRASAALVGLRHRELVKATSGRALIAVPDAQLALIEVLRLFEPPLFLPESGVHASAVVHSSATIGPGARIGPHVSVGPQAIIGENVVLGPGVCIGGGVAVGLGTVIHANSVIRDRCQLGARVLLHQNVNIGADGFGYRPSIDGTHLVKMPHVGTVIIDDDVEIGAGTCVDRGKFGATLIGAGTKIDNLCQIAHNCRIGRSCVIAGLTGLAGSVTVGDGTSIGGCVGVFEHIRIGKGARIGGGSAVIRDVPDGETQLGYPADSMPQALRQWAAIRKLPGLLHRLSRRDIGGPEGRCS